MKKTIGVFMSVLFVLLAGAGLAQVAENLTGSCQVTSPDKLTGAMLDGQYTTYWNNKKGTSCVIEVETPAMSPASWLYLCFGEIPEAYAVETWQDGQWVHLMDGSTEYAHVVLNLGSQTHFRIVDTAEKRTLWKVNELMVFGEGTLPEWVQQWQPPLNKADLLLLVGHPDDELLFFGGLIPEYGQERGLDVCVAVMTMSNTTRRSELLNGLWFLGVRHYPVIGPFWDSYSSRLKKAYEKWGPKTVQRFVTDLVRSTRPEVVVTHDVKGEYGHGVHMLCADAMMKIMDKTADPSFLPESAAEYGTWQVKKLYLHLYKEQMRHMSWDTPLMSFGGKTGLELAREAYKLHVTQQTTAFLVDPKGSTSCELFGLAYSAVGRDETMNDFMEHIPEKEPKAQDGLLQSEPLPEISGRTPATEEETAEKAENPGAGVAAAPAKAEMMPSWPEDEEELFFHPTQEQMEVPETAEIQKETEEPERGTQQEAPAQAPSSMTSSGLTLKAPDRSGKLPRPRADVLWPVPQPELDADGYPLSGETILEDADNGIWFYASPTLVVRVDRIFDPQKVITWYEAQVFCDCEAERFGVIQNEPENPTKKTVQTEYIARNNQVVFGMNTDYYSYRLGRKTITGMVIRGGKTLYDRVPEMNRRQFPNLDTLALYEDGHWGVYHSDELSAQAYLDDGAVDVFSFGPYLLRAGERNPFLETMTSGRTEQPRCAIGMVEPGHYVAVLAEGRMQKISVGVDIAFLVDVLERHGCQEALNMDGGQTAVMAFMGKQITRIGRYAGGRTTPRETTEILGVGHSDAVDANAPFKK